MDHPLRTLLYEFFVEPVLRALQRRWISFGRREPLPVQKHSHLVVAPHPDVLRFSNRSRPIRTHLVIDLCFQVKRFRASIKPLTVHCFSVIVPPAYAPTVLASTDLRVKTSKSSHVSQALNVRQRCHQCWHRVKRPAI